jgi:putative FmdB family regulatory protein
MPIYEYRCPDGHTFETFQRMSDAPAEVCEVCGKGPVEKLLYPVAVHFKGSGFYSTDYGRSGRKGAGKDGAEAGSSSSSDGKPSSSGDAAPAKASESKSSESKSASAD